MKAKPRLKLHLSGRLSVLSSAELGWTATEARSFIKQHYGSVGRFSAQFLLPYGAACAATEPDRERVSARSAGDIALVRSVLGLRSNPSASSVRIAEAHAKRRQRKEVTRLPYPQTVQSARTYIVAHGLSVSGLARANNLPRLALQDLLRPAGQLKGQRGQAHLAAIVLGLKPPSETPAALDPNQQPRRKNAAGGASV